MKYRLVFPYIEYWNIGIKEMKYWNITIFWLNFSNIGTLLFEYLWLGTLTKDIRIFKLEINYFVSLEEDFNNVIADYSNVDNKNQRDF